MCWCVGVSVDWWSECGGGGKHFKSWCVRELLAAGWRGSRGMWRERLGWENLIWVRPFWGFLDLFSSFNGSFGISNSGGYSSGFLFFWRDLGVILDLCIFLPFEKFSFCRFPPFSRNSRSDWFLFHQKKSQGID